MLLTRPEQINYQRLLEGVARSSAILLKTGPINDVLHQLVCEIGNATQVDRCYIFRLFHLENKPFLKQESEWVQVGISQQIGNPMLQSVDFDLLPGLYENLYSNQPYSALVKNSPDLHRQIMEAQDILSYLFLPIFRGTELWGFIGYDDCTDERFWSETEVNTLATLASSIGSYLQREALEYALKEKNAKYELALRGSQAGIWEMDLRTRETFISDQWQATFGHPLFREKGLSSEEYMELIHPEDRAMVELRLEKYLQSGQGTLDMEYRIRHVKGHYLWVFSRSAAEWDQNGVAIRVGGSDSDITERRVHETLLAENERQYRELVNSLNDVVFESDIQGQFTFLNQAWEKLTGYTIAESIGKRGGSFVAADDEMIVPAVHNRIMQEDVSSVSQEFRYRKKDGKTVWVLMEGNKVRDKNGTPIGYNGTITNIQSRREAEFLLIESEAKYRLISENMTDLVTQHDFEGKITFVSSSLEEWLGYCPLNLPSNDPYYYFHPDDVDHIRTNAIEKLKAGEQSIIINYRLRHAQGHYVWVESLTKYVFNPEGRMIAIQVSTRNITERKKAEEDIRYALEKEKELRDLKARFIVMASHEFRTPLATIQSSLDLLQHYFGQQVLVENIKTTKHFSRIRNEIKKVTDLMNDILVLGKLEGGSTRLKLEKTDIIDLVNELIEDSFSQGKDPRLPEFSFSGFPRPIFIDQQLMRHALSNLISNALKFSQGKAAPHIALNYLKNKVQLAITDYGIGIPKNEKNRIFESFYRGSNTTEFQGTGLGLVISKEFVELHHGKIWMSSVPGKKTVFTIELNL